MQKTKILEDWERIEEEANVSRSIGDTCAALFPILPNVGTLYIIHLKILKI